MVTRGPSGPWIRCTAAVLVALVLPSSALAEMPLPSYRDVLTDQAYRQVNALVEHGWDAQTQRIVDREALEEAIAQAQRFEHRVTPDTDLAYLIGLSYRHLEKLDSAARHLHRAVTLDATNAAAWFDLGEVQRNRGQLTAAESAYASASALVTTGPGAWAAPLRLAELAGRRGDPDDLEDYLREALRRGFTFRIIAHDPNWQALYREPSLQRRLDKLMTVYSDPDVAESLRTP